MMHVLKRVACIRKDLDKCLRVVFSSWEAEMSKWLWLNTIYKRWEWLILQIRATEQHTEFPCLFNLIRLYIITGERTGFCVRTGILHFNLIRQSQDEITNSSSRRHVLLSAVLAHRWTKTKTLTLNEVYLDGLRCNCKRNVFQQLAIQRRCGAIAYKIALVALPVCNLSHNEISSWNLQEKYSIFATLRDTLQGENFFSVTCLAMLLSTRYCNASCNSNSTPLAQ